MRYFVLLLLVVAVVVADPAKRSKRSSRLWAATEQQRRDDLDTCLDELSRLYQYHDQGKFATAPRPESRLDNKRSDNVTPAVAGDDPVLIDQRLKAKTAHVIEALRRARLGLEETCADLEGVLHSRQAPADAVRTRQAQKAAERKAEEALGRFRARPGVKIDASFIDRPDFEYVVHGPNAFEVECKNSCECMLEAQRQLKSAGLLGAALGSSGQLVSQLFREQTAVVAKEQNMANGNLEILFFYYSPGSAQIIRIEHYLFS